MRVGFPHMGNFYIPFEALLKTLGISVVVPPRPSRASVQAAVRHTPEFICFPMKSTLGDLICALEKGADTLAWFEGPWSCRFGYYGRLHHQILRDMGYRFNSLLLNSGDLMTSLKDVRRATRFRFSALVKALRLSWHKSKLVRLTESLSRSTSPYGKTPRETTGIAQRTLKMIREAQAVRELRGFESKIVSSFKLIPKYTERKPLKIMLVGEVYMVLEPEANFHLVEYLGEHQVLVTPFTSIHNWMFRSIGAGKRGRGGENATRKLAIAHLPYCLGGEDQLSIGYTVLAKKRGYDGVIHVRPFTCMTENVAHPIIHQISREYDIPVLSFSLDEHTESVGFFTRVEAFLEILDQRRKARHQQSSIHAVRFTE